ncbi:MAG: hypothetical protein Roseis2KO_18990 [Roseivirga sp.]
MEKEIIWSNPAKTDLQNIYEFNIQIRGEEKAFELIKKIMEVASLLESKTIGSTKYVSDIHPEIDYQKLIWSHYLIIFRFESDDLIYINRVFDSRQNPSKLSL